MMLVGPGNFRDWENMILQFYSGFNLTGDTRKIFVLNIISSPSTSLTRHAS